MKKKKWWGVRLAVSCALAGLSGAAWLGDAHGAYIDCRVCHLDPTPGSGILDFYDYFAAPRRQHPTGMLYSSAPDQEFFRPTAIAGDIAFFDTNGNGLADWDEIQLFGAGATVECASCHREHGDAPPPPAPNMYLRMPADRLCMVCHRI